MTFGRKEADMGVRCWPILATALALTSGCQRRGAVDADKEALHGAWVLETPSDKVSESFAVIFDGGRIALGEEDSRTKNRYRLYPTIHPKGIDLIDEKAGTVKCIYAIQGDRLTLGVPFI